MNKFIFTTISLILFSVSLTSKDFSSERGMTNILGNETWERCSAEMNKQGSQVYELSYERSSTMPKSPLQESMNLNTFHQLDCLVQSKYTTWKFLMKM
ncbi:MAG: hypothetical protein Ct9H90mP4_01820 [Gammaproteobacteria bacterium]|nr:MAG: hypothetical protein Ct9H90mP4_01820 [Gammaproteobacteria bacterium]